MAPPDRKLLGKRAVLVAWLIGVPVAMFALPPVLQKQAWRQQTREGFKTGIFPECKRKIEAYFNGDGEYLSSVRLIPGTLNKEDASIKGKLDIDYSLSGGGDITPEQGAQAYAAGVAAGIRPSEMAEAVTDRMTYSSYDYKKRVEFAYYPKSDTCFFGKKVTDVETGEEDGDSSMTSVMNEK